MSQAMLMRIVALEAKIKELEDRADRVESVLDAHFHANEPSFEEITEILEATEPVDVPFKNVHDVNAAETYWLEQHGVSWFRVFGPEGEITEKGLRLHEARALADELNERAVSEAG